MIKFSLHLHNRDKIIIYFSKSVLYFEIFNIFAEIIQ